MVDTAAPSSSSPSGGVKGGPESGGGGGGRRRPLKITMPAPVEETPAHNLDDKCSIRVPGSPESIEVRALELERIEELGRGAYGVVEKMLHPPSGLIMAVKRIHSTGQSESEKRTFVELDACMKSERCPQMVRFYGAMFREGDVWLCMEVMDLPLDRFYRRCFHSSVSIPEYFLAVMALSVIEALHFMKEHMNMMHRDVKPSNILLSKGGQVKLCDFGISGQLTNSVAKTVDRGCKPYMAPERIMGDTRSNYSVRSDVWSLGITIVEVATGTHPYSKWKTPFEQLKQVITDPAPRLSTDKFSEQLSSFVAKCLIKEYENRPKFGVLLEDPLMVSTKNDEPLIDMAAFVQSVLDLPDPPTRR